MAYNVKEPMHSRLIISKDKNNALEYIQSVGKTRKIDQIDISVYSFEKAVGIEDVREIQKKLFLQPIKSKEKATVIQSFEGITIEAQNALLKILEEPPANTIIFITLAQKEMVLPTILSRCQIIELKDEVKLSKEEISGYLNTLTSLPHRGIGERLKLASEVTKTENDIFAWLEKMILVARQKLIETPSIPQYLNILISLQKTYYLLKTTTVNKRFALENLFLSLPAD